MAIDRRFDPQSYLQQAGIGRAILNLQAGAVVFKQGDPTDLVFYLQKGTAKEGVTSETGKEAIVNILEAGVFFGTAGLDGATRRTSTVTAVSPCIVTSLTRAAIDHALRDSRFVRMFLQSLLDRSSKIEAEKVDLLLNGAERRLATKLLSLSHDGAEVIAPQINQQMLSEMIGTTRPRVSTFLTKFRALGFVQSSNRGIRVDPTLSKVVTQKPAGE
jgi:CRP/FNR family cyclic AMP-dependent transcriptional regulator